MRRADPIELPDKPDLSGNPMRISAQIVECPQTFGKLTWPQRKIVEFHISIRQFYTTQSNQADVAVNLEKSQAAPRISAD